MVQESPHKHGRISAAGISERSTEATQPLIEPDRLGNLFVLRETVDVPQYYKWLEKEMPQDVDLDEK